MMTTLAGTGLTGRSFNLAGVAPPAPRADEDQNEAGRGRPAKRAPVSA
jgi:hypothetical protein